MGGDFTAVPARSQWLDKSDWAAVGRLLDASRQVPPVGAGASDADDPEMALRDALERFERQFPDECTSAAGVINPLLDLWALAREVGPAVAAPFEQLLSGLVMRGSVRSSELAAVAEAARSAPRFVDSGR